MPRSLARTATLTAAVAFAAFPLLRPWGDKTGDTHAMTEAFASPAWVAAHSLGMLAWACLTAALALTAGRGRWSRIAAWTAAAGTAAILPYYGAETFGLHGLASTALAGGDVAVVAPAAEAIRNGAPQTSAFGVGLLLLAASGAALAVDTWRRATRHHWVGIPVAAGLATYLPQFFAPDVVRQGHGVALGIALAVFALLRTVDDASSSRPKPQPQPSPVAAR